MGDRQYGTPLPYLHSACARVDKGNACTAKISVRVERFFRASQYPHLMTQGQQRTSQQNWSMQNTQDSKDTMFQISRFYGLGRMRKSVGHTQYPVTDGINYLRSGMNANLY